jgi:hypothetical protein
MHIDNINAVIACCTDAIAREKDIQRDSLDWIALEQFVGALETAFGQCIGKPDVSDAFKALIAAAKRRETGEFEPW